MLKSDYDSLAVILTAVEVETRSIHSIIDGWKRIEMPQDTEEYYETFITGADGSRQHIITAQQKVMGMTAATLLAVKCTILFRPRYLIMCGIAAGTGELPQQIYGDIIVPDIIWDYTTGKYVGKDETDIRFGDVGFLPRPVSIKTHPSILETVRSTIGSAENEYHVLIGPMACGSCVVANEEVVEKQIKSLFPTTIGLDMESYSIYYVAENASLPRPIPIVAKSICDFADSQKDDRFQRFAAYNSANYVKLLLENHLQP